MVSKTTANQGRLLQHAVYNLNEKHTKFPLPGHQPNCGLVTPYGDIDLGQHWLSSGLLPDGPKPQPEPMLISLKVFCGIRSDHELNP